MKQITNTSENIQHSWLSYSEFNKIYSIQLSNDSLDNEEIKQEINSASINSITYKTKETHLYRFYQADRIAPDQAQWIELQDLQTATTSFAPKN
ncbi:hypothetical protein [Rickettsiella massiliensis]|uniref:hypothetical protein n=1 Tax=Rickettsiella massiliensis TaxID=676517 RepID=UPI00029B21AE|nr:hypothetical protein [Rickettsiella massiliensis]